MIKIKVGFLLAIPLNPKDADTKLDDNGKRNQSNNKFSKATKTSKASKKFSKGSKASNRKIPEGRKKSAPPKPPHVYDVGKPLGYLNIQYALFPNKPGYSIDVIYWQDISKIFFGQDEIIYRHYTMKDNIWIPVMVQHKFEELSIEELLLLHKYSFNVVITPNRTKLGNKAKNDKTKMFYIRQSDLENTGIIEAFDVDPNADLVDGSGDLLIKSNIETKDAIAKINKMDKIFLFENDIIYPRMLKIIEDLINGKTISVKYYIPNALEGLSEPCVTFTTNEVAQIKWKNEKESKNSKLKGKGEKSEGKTKTGKSKSKNGNNYKESKKKKDFNIKISGETFFTDPCLSIYNIPGDDERLNQAFVLFSVYNLMTDEERRNLNPFVIKLMKVSGIPDNFLKRDNFSSIWLQYNIPYIGRTLTQPSEINRKILFNESHAYFYVPNDKMLQFCQTQRLRVELVGEKKKDELDPKLFGRICGDCNFKVGDPSPYLKEQPTTVILAVACFDLSLIVKPVPILEMTSPFRHPEHMLVQPQTSLCEKADYISTVTVNDINFQDFHKSSKTPLHDFLLLNYGTSLKIEVFTTLPIPHLPQLLMAETLFKRMLLIVYNEEIAKVLLNEIMLHNQNTTVEVILPNYFLISKKDTDPTCEMVSGFCVDNGNSYIIFIEATTINYVFETIWSQVKKLNENVCKIFYNSVNTFKFRIYEAFVSIGGILKISLKVPLQDIFKMEQVFQSSKVPKPCYKALIKLASMLRIQTFRELNQYCLFPTAVELLSFNLEFGVAHRLSG